MKNLSQEQQDMLQSSKIQNYIPWRVVWKESSLTTPCRIVFYASQQTSTGFSLNDILPKGRNTMNKLVEIIIRWTMHRIGFHTDVKKMYNSLKLTEDHWCLQRYIWQSNLDPAVIPEEKVIKTLIYGVTSSGNQAECAIRDTGFKQRQKYPDVYRIIKEDFFVDDGISGEESKMKAFQRADELDVVLRKGGFGLKGFTFTGKPPDENSSEDGKSVNVAGMKWFPEEDILQLDIGELNFSKKIRGKKRKLEDNKIPSTLTRRHCVSKVAEIFDLTGRITPLTAWMKLDLHELVTRKLNWDDVIPDDLRPVWDSHFNMMQEINNIRFKRAIIPDDAVNLEINTIDMADASQSIACVAIYARFLRKTGNYSCQLVFARSKLIHEGMTQPRAELLAASLKERLSNAHLVSIINQQ